MALENCQQKRSDCQFWAGGKCLILADTYFPKSCPFCKPCERDYTIDYEFPQYAGRTFRWVRGLGGLYLIARDGLVINSHGRIINVRGVSRGKKIMLLQYMGNWATVKVEDLIAESYPEERK